MPVRRSLWSYGELARERATGVEPATSSLGSWHSTTELRPRMDGTLLSPGSAGWQRAPIDAVPERRIRVSAVKGHARNMMTERVVTVGPDTPLVAIAATLVAERIGGVPVVEPGGAGVGFVSETDLATALMRPASAPRRVPRTGKRDHVSAPRERRVRTRRRGDRSPALAPHPSPAGGARRQAGGHHHPARRAPLVRRARASPPGRRRVIPSRFEQTRGLERAGLP